jgi:peroxiredoxin
MIMKISRTNGTDPLHRHKLEEQFQSLEPQIHDPAVKKAISLLHGMIQESWRITSNTDASSSDRTPGKTLQDIADLYRNAPKMEAPAVNEPLMVGMPAPDFTLPDAEGRMVSLKDFRGKRVLLVFYPLDWSPGCSQQLDLYQSEISEFEKRGIQIIGISVDSIYSHGAWASVRGISFPLLADFNPKGAVAKKYQVLRDEDGFTERALYLIDENGKIAYSHISPFLHHVPDIYQLYNELDELTKAEASVSN